MILALVPTLHFAAHGLVLDHSLCFEAWEGQDVGKDKSKDEVTKSELEKMFWFLLWEKKFHLFLIYNEVFHP